MIGWQANEVVSMSFCKEQFLKCGAIMSLTHDKLLVGWGTPNQMELKEIQHEIPAFYFSDYFFKDSRPWMQYPNWLELSINEFKECLKPSVSVATVDWILQQPEQFKKAFDELSKDLRAGRLKKAVPYLFAQSFATMTEERLCHSLRKCLGALEKKTGYLYGRWCGSKGILGVTPELLFSHTQREPQTINTMAVAGTCHPSQDQDAFFHNEKERHEHHLVVQGICQSLEKLGHIKVGELQLLRLPKLVHLMTPISLNLTHPFKYDALVQQLHPTPALGAFPLTEGKKWLDAFDQHTPRHYYGAPVGFHHPRMGLSHCFVAIRNVQWDHFGMRIGAGCGVVPQSTFEKEWKEIQIKIRAIRDQLNL